MLEYVFDSEKGLSRFRNLKKGSVPFLTQKIGSRMSPDTENSIGHVSDTENALEHVSDSENSIKSISDSKSILEYFSDSKNSLRCVLDPGKRLYS